MMALLLAAAAAASPAPLEPAPGLRCTWLAPITWDQPRQPRQVVVIDLATLPTGTRGAWVALSDGLARTIQWHVPLADLVDCRDAP